MNKKTQWQKIIIHSNKKKLTNIYDHYMCHLNLLELREVKKMKKGGSSNSN